MAVSQRELIMWFDTEVLDTTPEKSYTQGLEFIDQLIKISCYIDCEPVNSMSIMELLANMDFWVIFVCRSILWLLQMTNLLIVSDNWYDCQFHGFTVV